MSAENEKTMKDVEVLVGHKTTCSCGWCGDKHLSLGGSDDGIGRMRFGIVASEKEDERGTTIAETKRKAIKDFQGHVKNMKYTPHSGDKGYEYAVFTDDNEFQHKIDSLELRQKLGSLKGKAVVIR